MPLMRFICALLICLLPISVSAASSESHDAPALNARLITAENGVGPDAGSVSAGLVVTMQDGWKTYWRSPGEVGLPPEMDWSNSRNVAAAELLYPAPTRFTAFEIENFGYGGEVTFPIRITLTEPGAPAALHARVRLLVCKDICIPEDFDLTLALPRDTGIDTASAEILAGALARVPLEGPATGVSVEGAHLTDQSLILALRREAGFAAPDVFPELGEAIFGKPRLLLDSTGTRIWAEFPLLYTPEETPPLNVTVTDGRFAATLSAPLDDTAPPPPPPAARRGLLATALIAVLGGLILNVMPCVLPVLSIKLASAVQKAAKGRARVRSGFLWAALGVLVFFWGLGAVTWGLKGMGQAVGWGLQFQSPVFLTTMIVILVIFAANLFGLFEVQLPAALQTRMARAGGSGHLGDFATGAFAAVLATPCSAPFLGTAVAFALSGGALDIAVIFSALGLGLALPYLAVAAFPGVVSVLPKPGRWMLVLKTVMGGLLALTAAWLFFVLAGVAGPVSAGLTALIVVAIVAALALRRLPGRALAVSVLALGAIALPALRGPAPLAASQAATRWQAFDEGAITALVAEGRIVFVDVTADWCLTCKANKALVLDRDPVAAALASDGIVAMQADWTRSDPAISGYLEKFNRYGIPFNAVYGPGAPNGLPLPELLSEKAVFDAIQTAGD